MLWSEGGCQHQTSKMPAAQWGSFNAASGCSASGALGNGNFDLLPPPAPAWAVAPLGPGGSVARSESWGEGALQRNACASAFRQEGLQSWSSSAASDAGDDDTDVSASGREPSACSSPVSAPKAFPAFPGTRNGPSVSSGTCQSAADSNEQSAESGVGSVRSPVCDAEKSKAVRQAQARAGDVRMTGPSAAVACFHKPEGAVRLSRTSAGLGCAEGSCAQGNCAQGNCAQGSCAQGSCAPLEALPSSESVCAWSDPSGSPKLLPLQFQPRAPLYEFAGPSQTTTATTRSAVQPSPHVCPHFSYATPAPSEAPAAAGRAGLMRSHVGRVVAPSCVSACLDTSATGAAAARQPLLPPLVREAPSAHSACTGGASTGGTSLLCCRASATLASAAADHRSSAPVFSNDRVVSCVLLGVKTHLASVIKALFAGTETGTGAALTAGVLSASQASPQSISSASAAACDERASIGASTSATSITSDCEAFSDVRQFEGEVGGGVSWPQTHPAAPTVSIMNGSLGMADIAGCELNGVSLKRGAAGQGLKDGDLQRPLANALVPGSAHPVAGPSQWRLQNLAVTPFAALDCKKHHLAVLRDCSIEELQEYLSVLTEFLGVDPREIERLSPHMIRQGQIQLLQLQRLQLKRLVTRQPPPQVCEESLVALRSSSPTNSSGFVSPATPHHQPRRQQVTSGRASGSAAFPPVVCGNAFGGATDKASAEARSAFSVSFPTSAGPTQPFPPVAPPVPCGSSGALGNSLDSGCTSFQPQEGAPCWEAHNAGGSYGSGYVHWNHTVEQLPTSGASSSAPPHRQGLVLPEAAPDRLTRNWTQPDSTPVSPGILDRGAKKEIASSGRPEAPARVNAAEHGVVVSGTNHHRNQRGNVQVIFEEEPKAWFVYCAAGVGESMAFPIDLVGFEAAKRMAQQYASHCRRRCSSRRLNSKAPRGDDRPSRLLSRAGHESGRRLGSTVAPCPVVTIGMTGPPGGVFNLTERTSGDLVVSKSDFSASRMERLNRRAMEFPYVHGVRFEANNFAWLAQMKGESRRFLVKKHGFIKSRLYAVEKIEQWRKTLPEAELKQELEAEKEVLAMISSFVMALEGPRAESDSGSASVRRCVYPDAGA